MLFKQFLLEQKELEAFHTSETEITSLKDYPMWFALKPTHALKGWAKNILDLVDKFYVYKATLSKLSVVDIHTKKIEKLFSKNAIDLDSYIEDLVSNPSAEEIHNFDGTRLLIRNGINAIIHLDYDPRDFSKDLKSLLVFSPPKTLKSFELYKKVDLPN